MPTPTKTIISLTPSSFCRGVERSIEMLDTIIADYPDHPIYCYHAIVHNPGVTQTFIDKGVTFVESIDDIDDPRAVVAFSAHGIDRHILDAATTRFHAAINLECPLVTKVYRQVDMYAKRGITTFMYIGKDGHQEASNVASYARKKGYTVYMFQHADDIPTIDPDTTFGVLSQTTLNYATVKSIIKQIATRYPGATLPPLTDICKATYDRQTVILQNLDDFETLIVIGGKQSHNTRELCKIGEKNKKRVLYAEYGAEIIDMGDDVLFADDRVAVTGGASTPHAQMTQVYDYYTAHGYTGHVVSLEEIEGEYG